MRAGEEVNLLYFCEQHLQHPLDLLHLGEGASNSDAFPRVSLLELSHNCFNPTLIMANINVDSQITAESDSVHSAGLIDDFNLGASQVKSF